MSTECFLYNHLNPRELRLRQTEAQVGEGEGTGMFTLPHVQRKEGMGSRLHQGFALCWPSRDGTGAMAKQPDECVSRGFLVAIKHSQAL